MPFRGSQWEARGGNDREQRYLRKLEQIAARDGIVGPRNPNPLPEAAKSAAAKLLDMIQREEFAFAGLWDHIQGTGRADETLGGRFVSEAIGGTRLGNFLGVRRGARETFADVLEQGGVGEGGRLSDLLGDNRLTKYFDPTARGTLGMAFSVLAAPSTYMGAGLVAKAGGRAFTLTGRGGKVAHVSKTAKKLANNRFQKLVTRAGDRHGLRAADYDDFANFTDEVLKAEQKTSAWAAAGGPGRAAMAQSLQRRADATVAEAVLRNKAGLGAERATRALTFGDLGLFGSSRRGIKIASLEPAFKGARQLVGLLDNAATSTETGRALKSGIGKLTADLGKLFNEIDPRVGSGFRRYLQGRNARVRGAAVAAREVLNEAGINLTKLSKELPKDAQELLIRAIDNPEDHLQKYMSWAEGALPAGRGEEIYKAWNTLAARMGEVEVTLDVLKAGQYAKFAGRYIQHEITGLNQEALEASLQRHMGRGFVGADIGKHQGTRAFDTIDELEDWLAINHPDARVRFDAVNLFEERVMTHLRAAADAEFADDVLGTWALDPTKVFRHVREAVDTATVKPTPDQIHKASKVISKGLDATVAEYDALTPDMLTATVFEMLSRIDDLTTLDKYVSKFDDFIGHALGKGAASRVREAMDTATFGSWQGQPYVKHVFEGGPMKGKVHILPKQISESLKQFHGDWVKEPEVAAILSGLDKVTNTFKLGVTAVWPAFNARNARSNVAASMADIGLSAADPRRHVEAARVLLTSADGHLTTALGERIPYSVLRNHMRVLDIIPERLRQAELTGRGNTLGDIETKRVVGDWIRLSERGAQTIENEARALHFMELVRRGESFQDAAQLTKEFMFDYGALSKGEKEVFRRIFPFYTWTRKNVERQVRNLLTRPGRVTASAKLAGANTGPSPEFLPEYVRGDIRIGLKKRGVKAVLTGIDLPVENLDIIWAGGVGRTMRQHLAMVNPFLKNPIEFALGVEAFTGRSIRGQQWLGRVGPFLDKTWPGWAKEYVGFKKVTTADGRQLYRANGTAMYILLKNPFVSRFVNESVTVNEMVEEFGGGRGGAAQLMKFMSGLTLREYDFTEAQKAEARNKERLLEKLLLDRGSIAKFEKTFVPKGG